MAARVWYVFFFTLPMRLLARVWLVKSQKILKQTSDNLVAWPSGLRRWFKAPVSSEAWVRIPPLPHLLGLCLYTYIVKLAYINHTTYISHITTRSYTKHTWRCRGSNPGPFTCKANALPLSYIPNPFNRGQMHLHIQTLTPSVVCIF